MTALAPAPRPSRSGRAVPEALPRVDPITQLPIVILFPHSRCNCRCVMCDIWRVTNRDEIAAAEVARWLGSGAPLG